MTQNAIDTFLTQPEEALKFNNWVLENFQPYIKGRVLEIGSDAGLLSSLLTGQGIAVHLSELDQTKRHILREKFKDFPLVKSISRIDLNSGQFRTSYSSMEGVFSTVIALDIIGGKEIIKNTLENAKVLLRKGGHLIVVLPCYTDIYPGTDLDLKQLKKDDRNTLISLLGNCPILKVRYFYRNGFFQLVIARIN